MQKCKILHFMVIHHPLTSISSFTFITWNLFTRFCKIYCSPHCDKLLLYILSFIPILCIVERHSVVKNNRLLDAFYELLTLRSKISPTLFLTHFSMVQTENSRNSKIVILSRESLKKIPHSMYSYALSVSVFSTGTNDESGNWLDTFISFTLPSTKSKWDRKLCNHW